MKRAYYSDSIKNFLNNDTDTILGRISQGSDDSSIRQTQQGAWVQQIEILRPILQKYEGSIYFEYSIPRMGERIDVVLLIGAAIFVLEFKVGEKTFSSYGLDQVCDYALDLKNFHEASHHQYIAPVLIATEADAELCIPSTTPQNDKLLFPIKSNAATLSEVIDSILSFVDGEVIDVSSWEQGRYCPTPTIIEAALALYRQHSVADITRNDAKENLTATTDAISEVTRRAKERSHKAICFVTGVPGAGKTLIGLNIATRHFDAEGGMYSVLLSGNKPLVEVLQEIKEAGKTRFIGISSTSPHLIPFVRMGVFDTFQIPYSGLERRHENMISEAARAGAGIIIRGGVAKGQRAGRVGGPIWQKAKMDDLIGGMEPYEFLLRFTLTHPACHTTIVGTLNPNHVQANVRTTEAGPLSNELYEKVIASLTAAGEIPEN